MHLYRTILAILLAVVAGTLSAAVPLTSATEGSSIVAPIIISSSMSDSTVTRYGKFETILALEANYDNPYDYDEVAVSATFVSPSGTSREVDGFYMRSYDLNTTNGSLRDLDNTGFRIRFSPDEIGDWRFIVRVTDRDGTTVSPEQTFACIAPAAAGSKGFVRDGATNYLEFDDGQPYIPIGENMAWQNTNPVRNYRNWLNDLHNNGGNFIRLWHAHWGLGIEWKNGWQDFSGLRRYKEENGAYQDWLYDYCAERGIYVMLALQHHGPVSTRVNPNWSDSPYNVANGGPCQNTWDFFTNPVAIAHTKNRYRYILARWGYSRAIMSWELFNEVNWTDDYETHLESIRDWHAEMADYLKGIDPYQHLVTTSFAEVDQDSVIWKDPSIDFTQTHLYLNTSNPERALSSSSRDYLERYGKPTLNGEFGLGGSPDLSNADRDGIHLHNAIWSSVFGGGMGSAMTWWWDVYVEPRNLYYHFSPLSRLVSEIPFVADALSPATASVEGASGDLLLNPILGWGGIGDEDIEVKPDGGTSPENPRLSQFLYGSQWNTEFRAPPSFTVTYPAEGEFSVTTGGSLGNSARISIYINGSLLLNERATINTSYTVLVPPGDNRITVDNLGTDWASIQGYLFEDIGSRVDAYVLAAADAEAATGYVLSHEYNHVTINETGAPVPVAGAGLVVEGFAPGTYFAKWYDCLTGDVVSSRATTVDAQGVLTTDIPDFTWDLAFRIDDRQVDVVSTDDFAEATPAVLFPNPATAGAQINLDLPTRSAPSDLNVALFSAEGKPLGSFSLTGDHFTLPANLPAGYYLVKITGTDVRATRGLIVR